MLSNYENRLKGSKKDINQPPKGEQL